MNPHNHALDLDTTQRWMMAAITAPGGLPEGLARAQRTHGLGIEEVILAPPGVSPHHRLEIYAQGYWLRLLACLKADYPALSRLLGEELFAFFARAYLTNHPSQSYSLYDLGTGFARFLRRSQSASVQAADNGKLRFPLDLALIEQAMADSLRATGLEDTTIQPWDSLELMRGGNLTVQLPATTRLVTIHYPFALFQTWLDGQDSTDLPESSLGYLAVTRHRFHVRCRELTDWQFFFLLSLKKGPRPLVDSVRATARRAHRPVPDLLARLALWLPTAQNESMLELRRGA